MGILFCDDSYLQLPHDDKVSFWFRLGVFQYDTILLGNGSAKKGGHSLGQEARSPIIA